VFADRVGAPLAFVRVARRERAGCHRLRRATSSAPWRNQFDRPRGRGRLRPRDVRCAGRPRRRSPGGRVCCGRHRIDITRPDARHGRAPWAVENVVARGVSGHDNDRC
jgi:hypothetical protein